MAKVKKTDKDEKNIEDENTCGVEKKGNKYFCTSCGAVIDIDHEHCPECGNKVNWGRAVIEVRRGNQGW